MVHRWAAQSWNSGPRAQKWGTGHGHAATLGNAPEAVRDWEEAGKRTCRRLPAGPELGGSSPHGSLLASWNPSPLKRAAPHPQARYWWASGPCREVKMTHEHLWTGRLESQGGHKNHGGYSLGGELRPLISLGGVFLSQEVHRALLPTCGHNPGHEWLPGLCRYPATAEGFHLQSRSRLCLSAFLSHSTAYLSATQVSPQLVFSFCSLSLSPSLGQQLSPLSPHNHTLQSHLDPSKLQVGSGQTQDIASDS